LSEEATSIILSSRRPVEARGPEESAEIRF
jgi:hypothetical protein